MTDSSDVSAQQNTAWYQRWGTIAQLISATISVAVLCAVIFQARLIRDNATRANARQVYMSYSEAMLRYPQFSEPDLQKIKTNPIEYVRYKNFVAHMLFAYDEILTTEDGPEWEKSFQDDLSVQMPYICSDTTPEYYDMYFPRMRKLLLDAKAKCPPSATMKSSP